MGLFCPNCGEKLLDHANFCHNCGLKIDFAESKSKKSDTKEFKPVPEVEETPLDGPKSIEKTMETTQDLVEIIEQVDKKINEEISRHDSLQTEDDPDFIGPKMDDTGKVEPRKNTQPFTPIKEVPFPKRHDKKAPEETVLYTPIKDEQIEKTSEEPKQKEESRTTDHPFDKLPIKEKNIKKEGEREAREEEVVKTSESAEAQPSEDKVGGRFVRMWKNFINEDDDEYSIFSALKTEKTAPKEDVNEEILRKHRSNPSETLESEAIDESMDFSAGAEIIQNLTEEEEQKDVTTITETSETPNASKSSAPLKKKKKKGFGKRKKPPKPAVAPISENELSKPVKSERKDYSAKLSPIHSEKETTAVKSSKPETEKSASGKSVFEKWKKSGPQKKEKKVKAGKIFDRDTGKKERKITEDKSPTHGINSQSEGDKGEKKISSFFSTLQRIFKKPMEQLEKEEKNTVWKYFGIAFLFTVLNFVIAGINEIGIVKREVGTSGNGPGIFIPVIVLLKLFLSYITFRTAIYVGSEQAGLQMSEEKKTLSAVINWALSSILMFLTFLIHGGITEFTLFGAMTPSIWATALLYIFTVSLAYIFHGIKLTKKQQIDFMGWYTISFITIELVCKLIWFILNFFTTIF